MSIKSIIAAIVGTISNLWSGLDNKLKGAIHVGVVVTDGLKVFVDSEYADLLTAIIPGDLDDKIKEVLRAKLPSILIKMRLVDAAAQSGDPNEIVRSALDVIKGLDPSISGNFLDGLAVAIAQVVSDGKLTWDDGKYILKWYYDNQYKAQNGNTNS